MGVVSGTTCIPGLVNRVDSTSVYYLPRILDGSNLHDLEFEAEVSGFMDFLRHAKKSLPLFEKVDLLPPRT